MGRSRLLAAALVLSAVFSGTPAKTDDSGGAACSRNWPATTVCHFWFQGFPLIASGSPTQGGAGANMRVWISLDPDGLIPIVECTTSGVNPCSNGFPDSTCALFGVDYCPWYGAAQMQQLSCHVEGDPRGWFSCSSGSRPPT